jgi:hypothetical protein
MPGFENQTLWCANMNFSDPTGSAFHHVGEFTAAGDLAIGTGGVDPAQQIAVGHLVGTGGITIGFSAPNITIDGSGAGTPLTVHTDGSDAVESAGAISIVGAGGITTSGSGSTITITGSGSGGLSWNNISASQTMSVNNGYFCTGGGTLALALPAISAVGDTIEIYLDGSTGFTITQAAGQDIKFGAQVSTAGAGGSISSTGQGDGITMVCRTANLRWLITASMGNLSFV